MHLNIFFNAVKNQALRQASFYTSVHLYIRKLFNRIFFLLVFISSFLSGCFPPGSISNENFSSEYRDDDKNLHLDLSLFHFTADSSRLFVQFNTNELLFTKLEEDTFRAVFDVRLRIMESYDSPIVKGNAAYSFRINKTLDGAGKRIYAVDFVLPPPGEYLLECNIYDVNKRITETEYIPLDNSTLQSQPNFFFHRTGSQAPLFANYVSAADSFNVQYRSEQSQTLYVKYYNRQFDLASPPYSFDIRSQFNYSPDSIFTITAGNSTAYSFPKEGIYLFQVDSAKREGATLFRFPSGFPSVKTPEALIAPLRYITSRKEFDVLKSSTNKKQATDKFWLDIGGNQERSRQLIKKYYSRVEKANKLFSSYTEGWRTDRGMIYIVFGNPHTVYKSANGESWTYGDATSALSITFNFSREINPFSDNDYLLNRAPIYESTWYRAVDTWRQGRIFNDF